MPLINVVRGTDTTYQTNGAAQGVGSTFTINADFFNITFIDNDSTFSGDQVVNETPDDTGQTVDIGSGPTAIVYDYSFDATFGGVTYEFAVIDVDVNQDGNIGDGTIAGADPGEQVYYIAVLGPSIPTIPSGGATFTITDNINDNTNQPYTNFICFASGTLIDTEHGPTPVELIRPETRVQTMDNGLQPVAWAAQRRVPGQGVNTPVTIAAGRFGNDRALTVSPQHRMLLSSWKTELFSGSEQIFAPAKHLIDGTRVRSTPRAHVDYVHLLFERHEVIFAEGAATESLHPALAIGGEMGRQSQREILSLFPELATLPESYGPTARPSVRAHEARLIAA